jgi:hypothetical protein
MFPISLLKLRFLPVARVTRNWHDEPSDGQQAAPPCNHKTESLARGPGSQSISNDPRACGWWLANKAWHPPTMGEIALLVRPFRSRLVGNTLAKTAKKLCARGETRQIVFGVSTLRLNQLSRGPPVLHQNNLLTKSTSTGEPLFSRFFKALLSGDTVTIIRGLPRLTSYKLSSNVFATAPSGTAFFIQSK